MAIAGKRIPLYLLVIPGLLILTVLVSLSGAVNGPPEQSVNVLTENDFAQDPGLFANPDKEIVALFLESPLASDETNDTGDIGLDVIPYRYDREFEQTFCWEDGNETAEHYMSLIDVNEDEVVTVSAGGECVTETIAEGEYEMHVSHDGNSDRRVAVFIVPEGDKSLLTTAAEEALEGVTSVLNTDKCVGCDLSDVNLNNADLSDVDLSKAILNNAILVDADLSGADLSGAELVNADLSRANLRGANLSGADLTSAILINADLTDADLTLANLENADTKGANFSGTQSTGTFAAGNKATSGEKNQTDDIVSTRAVSCTTGDLPTGNAADPEDLEVTGGTCTVKSGTFNYRNVNIYSGGRLEFVDEGGETHFWAKSILVESGGEMSAGFDRETGTIKPFGDNRGVLTIHLYGSESDKAGIECKTTDCGITAKINVLDKDNPASCDKSTFNGVTDCFYKYTKDPDNPTGESGVFGRKVLAVSFGGTLRLFGKKGATYKGPVPKWDSGKSWVRLRNDKDAKPEKTIINLDREVDWDAGDRIVITTTDYLPGHSEELQIVKKLGPRKLRVTIIDPKTNMPPDGCTSQTLDNDKCGLRYLHNGDLYPDENFNFKSNEFGRLNLDIEIKNGGADNGKNLAETRAAVALLTRSIRIVSGGDKIGDDFGPPTPGKYFGGQTMIRQGFQEVKIQGVEFYQLGQGGRKGRYPAHFHLARKTPVGTYIKDSSVHDSMTRCYTLHGTHDVTLQRNVGYKSIGHCYYIEDGTEIENEYYSNIGIFARAAIKNEQNPREVPGILARGKEIEADVPFNSDIANPAVFWITNGWNDFEYNMAAGAGACGACYWLIPTGISGPSQKMKWEGYASIQQIPTPVPPALFPPIGPNGNAPLKKFRGNYCSTAQFSFNTVGATDACQGLSELGPAVNSKAPAPPPPNDSRQNYYPRVSGLSNPTLCNKTNCVNEGCSVGQREKCPVTVIDRYTSAFHWPEKNFAAIWLRGKWMLLSNSVLSDSQNGGLGLVTGGDYTLSSVIPGNWQVAMKSVFIGNTQDNKKNPLASNAGPFNPLESPDKKIKGLECENMANRQLYCLSKKEGVVFPISNFSMQQRLFNVYDGPNAQDSNAYMDITTTSLESHCKPGGNCPQVGPWMYTGALGIPIDQDKKKGQCVLPNAAIGWKQPNGFYYPPAFHSKNLLFKNVDIRHLVINPLWKPNTFESDLEQIEINYCTFDPQTTFKGFTAVDRQTVLNDDDGSLTGLLSPDVPPTEKETISVNLDSFFVAPAEAPECRSFDIAKVGGGTTGGTAKTSPYEYLTTVVYPKCALDGSCEGRCNINPTPCGSNGACPDKVENGVVTIKGECLDLKWGRTCSNESCYGVNLTRQLFTKQDGPNAEDRTIPMMGMNFFQRSMLTLNNAAYYIDTTVSGEKQRAGRGGGPTDQVNIFEPNGTYYVFFVYPTKDTKQEYQIFIGEGITDFAANMNKYIKPVRVNIENQALKIEEEVDWSGLVRSYDADRGIVTVTTDFAEFETNFKETKKDYCKPMSFCKLSGESCVSNLPDGDPLRKESDRICGTWAGKDIDCPLFKFKDGRTLPGCLGFAVTLGDSSQFTADNKPVPNEESYASCFPDEAPWNVIELEDAKDIAGEGCKGQTIPGLQFCQ